MIDEPKNEFSKIWQESTMEYDMKTTHEIRLEAKKSMRTVKWRNWREYAACLVVILVFSYFSFDNFNIYIKVGSFYLIMAALFVAFQIHLRFSLIKFDDAVQDVVGFHRKQLTAERDMLAKIWLWYLLPLAPGIILFEIGITHSTGEIDPLRIGGFVATTLIIWMLNAAEVRKLDRRIQALP